MAGVRSGYSARKCNTTALVQPNPVCVCGCVCVHEVYSSTIMHDQGILPPLAYLHNVFSSTTWHSQLGAVVLLKREEGRP